MTSENQISTADLVKVLRQYEDNNGDQSIIRAIRLELHHRPVKDRLAANSPV